MDGGDASFQISAWGLRNAAKLPLWIASRHSDRQARTQLQPAGASNWVLLGQAATTFPGLRFLDLFSSSSPNHQNATN